MDRAWKVRSAIACILACRPTVTSRSSGKNAGNGGPYLHSCLQADGHLPVFRKQLIKCTRLSLGRERGSSALVKCERKHQKDEGKRHAFPAAFRIEIGRAHV